MTTYSKALDLLKRFEGLSLTAYPDPGSGNLPITIGYGSTRHTDGSLIQMGDVISQIEADALLLDHVEIVAEQIRDLQIKGLKPNEFEALISFVYNLGIGQFKKSSLLQHMREGMPRIAANEFDKWIYSNGKKLNGLVTRRQAEKELFLS